MIKVIGTNYKPPENANVIDTTSRSTTWSVGLSPFLCGPCNVYGNYISKNVENLWQYSKVYRELNHLDDNDNPNEKYFKWAEAGWNTKRGIRYPAGRDAIPEYSYWDGEKLGYVEARKKIYVPCYKSAVEKTDAYKRLKLLYNSMSTEETLYLFSFDCHSLEPGTFNYWDLWNNPNIKVGHGYVLAMMLEGLL